MRSWLCGRLGRDYPSYATAKGTCSFPYQLVWEATSGSDGRGHVHAHVIVLWPWVDWRDVQTAWQRVTDGRSKHLFIERCRKGVVGAAHYVAKYASKGVDPRDMPGELSGRLLAAWYSKRVVSASRRFWHRSPPRCPCCGCRFDVRERPWPRPALLDVAARYAAALQAPHVRWLRRCGMLDDYRPPARPLRWG